MELAGDEKRIQALFSELSHEDAQAAPRFDKLWREARLTAPAPRFGKSLPVISAVLIVAVTLLFLAWPRDTSPTQQNVTTVAPQPAPIEAPEPEHKVVERRAPSHSNRRRAIARRQQRERTLAQAAMLANWKSPTDQFMTAPTRSTFNSLPQLNEAVKALESFLSKKESNQ
jgi:hypothetical protein